MVSPTGFRPVNTDDFLVVPQFVQMGFKAVDTWDLRYFVGKAVTNVSGSSLRDCFRLSSSPVRCVMCFHYLTNWVAFLSYLPFIILKASMTSPPILLNERVVYSSSFNISLHDLSFIPGISLVALH